MTIHQPTFIKAIGIFLGLIVLILGCGAVSTMFLSPTTQQTVTLDGAPVTTMDTFASTAASMPSKEAAGYATSIGILPYPQPGRSSLTTQRDIIKTAYLTIIVDDLRARLDALAQKASELGGFASSSSIGTLEDGTEQATTTVRVPANNTDAILQTIRSTALRVVNEQTGSDDATDQLVDIEARLTALHQIDDQYADILKRAESVDDILKVTQARNDVRQQIEQLDAQQQNIKNQTAFSTVTVSMSTETGLPSQPTWRPAQQARIAWQAFTRGVQGTVDLLIIGLAALPLIAIWLGLIWIGSKIIWKLIVWIRTRVFNQ